MVSDGRKRNRVATEIRLDVRAAVDSHMGLIYTRLLAIPSRLRGRELLALARERLALEGLAVSNARVDVPRAPAQPGVPASPLVQGTPSAQSPTDRYEHLAGFAEMTPPIQ